MDKKHEVATLGPLENPAQTMRDVITRLGTVEVINAHPIDNFDSPSIISVPEGREVQDITPMYRAAAEFFQPLRRRGKAALRDLASLIDWANRFKGETSALFANPDQTQPSLTCIADYHASGPVDCGPQGDETARHCAHRAVYDFPMSREWQRWMAVTDKPLDKDEMGEFIEANAKDVVNPTPALLQLRETELTEPWENRLIDTARQIEGRYGQLSQLLAMSRQFQVHETSNLTVTNNRDTGEQSIQFLNEHKTPDGQPLKIPNLILIGIPVFHGGTLYRMPVRFRYRKSGGTVKFILSIYNPARAFDDAFYEALTTAREATDLPLFVGNPEA